MLASVKILKDRAKACRRRSLTAGVKTALALGLASGLVLAGCHEDEPAAPTLTIVSPHDGDTLYGSTVTVKIKTTDWEYSGHVHAASLQPAALLKVAHGDVASGHVHLCLDNACEVDADGIMITAADGDSVVFDIPIKGAHYFIAQGANTDHEKIPGMRDSVRIILADRESTK